MKTKKSGMPDFLQPSKRGRILRAMTLNDITYWGADSFIFVVYALYIVNVVEGGSATHVGVTIFTYYFVRALLSIPIGQYFDKHCGYLDELWGLSLTSFATGAIFIFMSQTTELWHIYLAMALLGVMRAINLTSWNVLFYNNIEKEEYGQTVGIYQTAVAIVYALATALGGITGDFLGFEIVLLAGGIVVFFGGFIPITVRQYFLKNNS